MRFLRDFVVRAHAARTVWMELASYDPGDEGNSHVDGFEIDLWTQHDHTDRGGTPKGTLKAGTIELRAAFPILGERSMSLLDSQGPIATLARSATRRHGVLFVDGAHAGGYAEVCHRNDAGDDAGMTLIVTFRAEPSTKYKHLTPVERLATLTGIGLFAVEQA